MTRAHQTMAATLMWAAAAFGAPLACLAEEPLQPWFVHAILRSDVVPCKGAFVRLDLSVPGSKPLIVPINSSELDYSEWSVDTLEAGSFQLFAQLVSCAGVPGPLATLDLEHNTDIRGRTIYLGLEAERGAVTLDYLEASTSWNGEEFFTVERDGRDILVTNVSDVPLHRCRNGSARIYEEFLVGDDWDPFEIGGSRDWPEQTAVLKPGETVRMSSRVFVVKKCPDKPRFVRPTASRYRLTVQPTRKNYVTLTAPEWAPGGLPTCDAYYLELPTSENDPSLKFCD